MRLRVNDPHILQLESGDIPVELRRSPRARRLILRLNDAGDGVRVALPRGATIAEALAFARSNARWIEANLAALPPRVPFAEGALLPLLGEDHVVRHLPGARRGVWREAGTIYVSGQQDHLARRLTDFLKREARSAILPRARQKAAAIERPLGRVILRDTKTRWGSCSPAGDLSFSWRLILAPEAVLDYVVAHEVAHLAEHNHSRRFWRVCAQLCDDVKANESWLIRHGNGLWRYG